ncbi:VanZ family protein [Stanieria cyanosphaera PCC 7437]|uniref:VanZ family protein n=2 Tax=Stanieria cyanosphaera TaxID=102116 RepID=K9XQC7_STAC7|nr:VanZ family protein [Stanieria cyanosphaera PCC 7437]
MGKQMKYFKTVASNSVAWWANLFAIAGFLSVIIPTLFPYDFFFQEVAQQLSFDYLRSRMTRPDDFNDLIANIFLFIPFGFGITCLTKKFKLKVLTAFSVVLISSFTLSVLVEICQIFLPNRNPTYVDILMNSLGGLVGFFVFKFLGILIINFLTYIFIKLKTWKLIPSLIIIIFLIYFYLACLLSYHWQGMVKLWDLSNWNSNYPLALGNEITGKRPWNGQIFEFCVSDQSLDKQEIAEILQQPTFCNSKIDSLIASYILTSQSNYQNLKENTSDLVWQEKVVNQNPERWLQTKTNAAFINEKLRNSSQFIIMTTLASSDRDQTGPARIISLSQDSFNRNLTIGQWHNHLSLRLRTPLTKKNGTRPELIIPNVFKDTQTHRLIIDYNQQALSVYIDDLFHKYTFKFSPEATLFWYLSPSFSSLIHLTITNSRFYQLLYYGLIFIPLGILARYICFSYQQKWFFLIVMIGGLNIIPAFLFEAMMAIANEGNFNNGNLVLGSLLSLACQKVKR